MKLQEKVKEIRDVFYMKIISRLYDALKDCKKEEEVKAEFCKYFKYKINAFKSIDHYTKEILFEFKLDKNFKNVRNIASVIAQTMYYCRLLKYGFINKDIELFNKE